MRADYGARAVMDLAQRHGQGLTQTADIAARQRIPASYLEQLLTTLRKGGIVRSVRGPMGGHELARVPSDVSLGEVLDVLEGTGSPCACMEDGACSVWPSCVLQDVWRELGDNYQRIVHGVSVQNLVERQAERESRSMYYI